MVVKAGARWRDIRQILRRLTARRAWNLILLGVGYAFSRLSRRPFQLGLPAAVALEPTTSCNLRCPECPSGLRSFTRPTGMLQQTDFRRIIDDIAPHTFYLTFYFQGEPYLNRSFLDMVAYANEKGLYTATSTNGHYLTEETARHTVESGLCRLIISLDGSTQDVYQQYRVGGSLDKVLEGARRVVRWKEKLRSPTPHIIFQFLVVRPNEHQVPDILRLGREVGVDEVKFKTAQLYDYENGHPLIPSNPRYTRYRQRPDGRWEIKGRPGNHCWRMWHACVITWDGRVVPCCFDKDARHVLGHLNGVSLREVWHSEAYQRFRQHILLARREVDICTNCTEGARVWID